MQQTENTVYKKEVLSVSVETKLGKEVNDWSLHYKGWFQAKHGKSVDREHNVWVCMHREQISGM